MFKAELIPGHTMPSPETVMLLGDLTDEDNLMEHSNFAESKKWSDSKTCTDCCEVQG